MFYIMVYVDFDMQIMDIMIKARQRFNILDNNETNEQTTKIITITTVFILANQIEVRH